MHPSKLARTRTPEKAIAIFVTLLMVVNLSPVLAQTGPTTLQIQNFSNGKPVEEVQLDGHSTNSSAGISILKKTNIETASLRLDARGLDATRDLDLNTVNEFNSNGNIRQGTEAFNGSVHLVRTTRTLTLTNDSDFQDGDSKDVVADYGVHLASGTGFWEQQTFAQGPGNLYDSSGTGFDTAEAVDWTTGDGALRLNYNYKYNIIPTNGASKPTVRGGAAFAADPSDTLYIYGGWTGGGQRNDAYKLRVQNSTWYSICSPCTSMPPGLVPLGNASMVYNTATTFPELTGGDTGMMAVQAKTWALSSLCMTFWVPMNNLVNARSGQSEIYDDADKMAIVFGGMDSTYAPTNTVYIKGNDALWHDKTGSVTGLPSVRYGHSAVWDPTGKKMYVFGGMTGTNTFYDDLYSYDPNTYRFTKLAQGAFFKPSPRAYQGAIWDQTNKALIIVGGRDPTQVFNDIWVYWPANDTWVKLPFVIEPNNVRWSMATAWSTARGWATVWGGMNDMSGTLTSEDLIRLTGLYSNKGTLTSSVIDAGATATWMNVNINTQGVFGANPAGTMQFDIRTGLTSTPNDLTWSGWITPNINSSLDMEGVMPGQYMQYRLTLKSFTSRETPVVYNLSFTYDVTATSGYLTTHEYDLRETPLFYSGLSTMIWDSPPYTRTVSASDFRTSTTDRGTTLMFTDNQTLASMPAGRYVRFNISMASTVQGISPYLISLSLSFVVVPAIGVFQLKIPHDNTQIFWFQSDWNSTGEQQGTGKGKISVSIEVDGKRLDLAKGSHVDIPHPPFSPPSLLINITFTTDGHWDPRLLTLHIRVGGASFPSEVTLDIGNDKSVDFTWPGIHFKGNTTQVPFLKGLLSDYLKSPKAIPDETGNVLVPLALHSETPGLVVLIDISVVGTIANMPPNIISKPPLTAQVGVDYRYPVLVDNKNPKELNFSIIKGPKGMLFSDNLLLWTPEKTPLIFEDVTIGVSDGIDMTKQSWTVKVDNNGTGHLPAFQGWPPNYQASSGTVPMRYGDTFFYHLDVVDPDQGDLVTLSIERSPKAMSLSGEDLKWIPSNTDLGNFTVILRAFDGKGSSYQTFRIVVGANKAPTIDQTIPMLKVKAGKTLSYKVIATDKDKDTIQYSLKGAPAWLSIDSLGTISGKPGNKDAGTRTFKVMVSDGHLNTTADASVNVAKDNKIGGMAQDDLMALLIILLIVCIVIIVVAFVVVRSRKKKSKDAKLEAELSATRPAPPAHHAPVQEAPTAQSYHQPGAQAAPVAPAAAVEAPLPEPTFVPMAEPIKEEKPIIEEIYFIYNDGRLIAHESSRGGMVMDEHVLSGMLKAIQEFVKDSFQKEGALGGLDYGDSRILLESGNCATFAIVLKGRETKALREETRRALEKIEGLYAGVIECWDGDASHFGDVKKYFGPIFALGKTTEEMAEAGEVKVLSALEFYQGYVRLKAAVKNTYPYMVYEVTLKILYDKKALQLTYIEPEYEREGSEVTIGNIPPNEKKTVAFYLDPLICMESSIDATVLFKNYKGELKTVLMKRRPVDIVCPIFYTEQNVNVAMLKRLISELKYKDSKIYSIPKSMFPSQAMDLAKAVISSRDVKFVREFNEETPYLAEAWFYGKTKHTLEDLVIRATMREENGFLEIFVCSNNLATLPGLLADLGHGIKKRYMDLKKTKEGLTQVTDVKIKDELEKSRLLIDKYVSTEAEAHADETEI